MKKGKRDYTVDAVVRSLVILEALAEADQDLGVLELSKIVKIHVSTVYRLLSTLQERGFVEQCLDSGKYRLGIRIFELGMARIRRMDFRAIAIPHLQSLQNELGETVFLGILRDHEALIVEAYSQFRGIVFRSQPGATEPLYCTGVGKALLAHLPEKEREKIVQELTLKKFTPKTITRKRDLRAELNRIRERGYSVDDEEIEPDVKCVAVPVLNHEGVAVAAFSVAGPKQRMESRMENIIARVLEVSATINSKLGFDALGSEAPRQGRK